MILIWNVSVVKAADVNNSRTHKTDVEQDLKGFGQRVFSGHLPVKWNPRLSPRQTGQPDTHFFSNASA